MSDASDTDQFSDLPEFAAPQPPPQSIYKIDVAMFGKCRVCHAATDKGAELCDRSGCTEIWRAGETLLAMGETP